MKKVKAWMLEAFSLDIRSLALFRIAFGSVLISDIFFRLLDAKAFFTDEGILPREVFLTKLANSWNFSILLMSGELWVINLLFLLGLVSAFLYLIGFKTRLNTILLWVFISSVHNRNWMINSSGDDLFRLFLLIGFFLPLDKRYSTRAALVENTNTSENKHYSVWAFVITAQLFAIYYLSYLWKDHPRWREDYSAVFYTLQLENFSTGFGLWLSQFIGVIKAMTFFSIRLEQLGPILLIVSLFLGRYGTWLRFFISLLFILFHIGLILTLKLGTFPWILISIWLVFIPTQIWDWLATRLKNSRRVNLKIYYDGECGFCRKLVLIIREFFLFGDSQVKEAQSDQEIFKYMQEHNSWIVVNEAGEKKIKIDAMIEVWKNSPLLRYFAFILKWSPVYFILTKKYEWVANNRNKVGILTSWLRMENSYQYKRLLPLSVIFAIIYLGCLWQWNNRKFSYKQAGIRVVNLLPIARELQLFQEWDMFSPYPLTNSRWFYTEGVTEKGEKVNLSIGGKFELGTKPDYLLSSAYSSKFWRKYFNNMEKDESKRIFYLDYLCRKNSARNQVEKPIVEVHLYMHDMMTQYPPLENNHKPFTHQLIQSYRCK